MPDALAVPFHGWTLIKCVFVLKMEIYTDYRISFFLSFFRLSHNRVTTMDKVADNRNLDECPHSVHTTTTAIFVSASYFAKLLGTLNTKSQYLQLSRTKSTPRQHTQHLPFWACFSFSNFMCVEPIWKQNSTFLRVEIQSISFHLESAFGTNLTFWSSKRRTFCSLQSNWQYCEQDPKSPITGLSRWNDGPTVREHRGSVKNGAIIL